MSTMRCAIYARYSSDAQNPRSLDDQIQECKNFAARKGWQVSEKHIYRDAALSGSNTQRPEYLRLKQAASEQCFDYIIVDDLSRLGRDMAESSAIFKELSDIGIFLASVADGIDTASPSAKIPYYFRGIMNEMFLDDMKTKIVRGLKGQVLRGYSAGGRVYGYTTKQILDPSGAMDKFGRPKRLGCEVLIDEEQALIVREIFEIKAKGFGYRYIADYLNTKSIPSPHANCGHRSGYWSRSTIRSLIHQCKYIGDWTWNKTSWLNKNGAGKRKVKKKPDTEWVKNQNEALRIIDDNLWDSIHEHSKTYKKRTAGPRGQYLLSGILGCRECGSTMVVQNSARSSTYMCNGYRNGGASVCKNSHRLSRFSLESKFLSELQQLLIDPAVFAELGKRATVLYRNRRENLGNSRKVLLTKKAEIQRVLKNLVAMIEQGDTSQTISTQIRAREDELLSIERQLSKISDEPPTTLEFSDDWIRERLSDLAGMLERHNDTVPRLKQEIKNLFPDRLKVAQKEANDEILFEISGQLHPFQGLLSHTSIMSYSGAGT